MAGALALILAWALFAFGAVYPWASRPIVAAAIVLAAATRPRLLGKDHRLLDLALLTAIAVALVQLAPLPASLRLALSPHSSAFHSALALLPPPASAWIPLSLVPGQTMDGAGICIAAILLFWITRGLDSSRAVRALARNVAWMGLLTAILALVSGKVFTNGKVYGFWTPIYREAATAGPLISRNHFAAWMILAVSLTAGSLIAQARTHWQGERRQLLSRILGDARALWLAAAGALMMASLVLTTSRAGTIGIGVALAVGVMRAWRRLGTGGRIGLIANVAVLLVAVSLWARPDIVAERLNKADSWGGRPEIWRQTGVMLDKYWVAGIGLGTFDVAMSVYQPMPRPTLFNHAHNQYLHTLVEGGVLLAVPLAVAIAAFLGLAMRRLRADETPVVHVREGALAGLIGFAVQCVWETPLLTPAVFMLMAVVAGLVVHAGRSDQGGSA